MIWMQFASGEATATNHSSQQPPPDNITHMTANETVPLTSGRNEKEEKRNASANSC